MGKAEQSLRTVNLRLVSQSVSTQTEWAHSVVPNTGGSNQFATFDAGKGTTTIDVTDGVKEWFEHYSPHVIVLVGPDENEIDALQFWYSHSEVESFTIEKV